MSARKLGKVEKDGGSGLTVAVATLAAVLMLLSQLALAADGCDSKFAFETNYDALGDSEPENNGLEAVTPDFLHAAIYQLQGPAWHSPVLYFSLASIGHHASSANIRAPPILS